jgi:hypothetical protein
MDAMDTTYHEIVLAAWLHSIESLARLAGCDDFLPSVKDIFPKDVKYDEAVRLILKHRTPETYDEWLIAHAVRLSNAAIKTEQEETGAFFNKPLPHIMTVLRIPDPTIAEGALAYCPLRTSDDYSVF